VNTRSRPPAGGGTGMKLGKKKPVDEMFAAIKTDGGIVEPVARNTIPNSPVTPHERYVLN
jgi:hypothetical protein